MMSQKHNISIIVSIHQPNIEVLDTFDSLYVLSKGGVNVYWGGTKELARHMIECGIDIKANDFAIESLLKLCAKNFNDSTIRKNV